MSRVGQSIINIPSDVEVKKVDNKFLIKGSKGELIAPLNEIVDVIINEKEIKVELKDKNAKNKALWGTTRALINNAVHGVSVGFEKEMEIVESYKCKRSNTSIVMSSDRMIKSIDPNYEYEEVPGKVVKSKMENFNDDGKSAFSMVWEIKSIKKKSYNSYDFVVGKKLKKVENFE